MTIKEVSTQLNLTEDTLRYYEKMGLVKPGRTTSNIRVYSKQDIERLRFVICMRKAGVSIEGLRDYIILLEKEEDTSKERREILLQQREILLKRKQDIDETLDLLNHKIEWYETHCLEKKDK